jgi:hypothetical protein
MGTMAELASQQAKGEKLSRPMPEGATRDGWRQETWDKWAGVFSDLATSLAEGRPVAPASISRALDFDGVHGGAILEAAATLSNQIRSLC